MKIPEKLSFGLRSTALKCLFHSRVLFRCCTKIEDFMCLVSVKNFVSAFVQLWQFLIVGLSLNDLSDLKDDFNLSQLLYLRKRFFQFASKRDVILMFLVLATTR